MAVGLVGKKIGMTRIFLESGVKVPVTVLEAGPCTVLQIMTAEKNGYQAVQLAFGQSKPQRMKKPLLGTLKAVNLTSASRLRELRTGPQDQYRAGQVLTVSVFKAGDWVDVIGTSIGKGFQGGVKKWGWRGGGRSHGSMHHRRIGSNSASSDPSRTFKGHHMPGRMGNKRITVQNLQVVDVDPEKNILAVRGAVPGHDNAYVMIQNARKHPDIVMKEKES